MTTARSVNDTVTFAILAGGQGRRLNGADKGLVEVAGRRMLDWVMASVPEGKEALIVANRNLDAYRALGPAVISDPWPESLGPLAGMLAALRAAKTGWVQMLSCDGLLLPGDLSQKLLSEAHRQACVAAYPLVGFRGQFLHVLLNRRAEPQLAEAIERGKLGVGQWLRDIGACAVAMAESSRPLIWSVNTPDEQCRAEEKLYALSGNRGPAS